MLFDPQIRAVGVGADDAERRACVGRPLPGDQRAGPHREEPALRPASASPSESSVNPAARQPVAPTVTQTWNGDGDASMNSQRPCGLAAWFSILTGIADDLGDRVQWCPIHCRSRLLAPLTPAAIFLVVTIDEGGEAAVHDALADISGLVRAVGFRDPTKHLSVVTSIGSDAWDRLFSGPRPAELHPFVELQGAASPRPSTPGDLLFHIKASRWTCASSWRARSSRRCGAVTVVDEVHGFKFFDNRDLLGFVDGTENPDRPTGGVRHRDRRRGSGLRGRLLRARAEVPARHGGVERAVGHREQEQVIGRTKLDDIEMDDDVKPANSHIALNVIEDEDGNELKIVRHNMPFGEIGKGEFGTYYIGYSRTAAVTERMLGNMFIGDPPGNTDRILDFSTAVTGGMFFTPTVDFLDDPPPLRIRSRGRRQRSPRARPATDHCRIGSLKGTPR